MLLYNSIKFRPSDAILLLTAGPPLADLPVNRLIRHSHFKLDFTTHKFIRKQSSAAPVYSPSYSGQSFPELGYHLSYLGHFFPQAGQMMSYLGDHLSKQGQTIFYFGRPSSEIGEVSSEMHIIFPQILSGDSS